MSLLSKSTATAVGTCSECESPYRIPVELSEGENEAYVRCSSCRHINHSTTFKSPGETDD